MRHLNIGPLCRVNYKLFSYNLFCASFRVLGFFSTCWWWAYCRLGHMSCHNCANRSSLAISEFHFGCRIVGHSHCQPLYCILCVILMSTLHYCCDLKVLNETKLLPRMDFFCLFDARHESSLFRVEGTIQTLTSHQPDSIKE